MKNIRHLLSICFIVSVISLQAQTESKFSYGIKAGFNLSSAGGDFSDSSLRSGYHFGVTMDYDLSKGFFLRSGLDFTSKGAEIDNSWDYSYIDGSAGWSTDRYTLNYLQLPLQLGFRLPVFNNKLNLVASAGMYFAYGVYAREKYDETYASGYYTYIDECTILIDYPIVYEGFDEIGMRRFDCGFTGGLGVEFSRYSLSINYEGGILNTMKELDGSNPSWKNRSWAFSFGYKF
ncbi:porin family protein [Dysgonomonas macrotermitis]|uniref:Outer membrane protein beta-barrel domain-containing protein n=1 Tax=Dysgonomonas macrotermitis TaxID=1346286 RepID=A0A1M4U140_9BACT|nr:porin family protein [Dysgonomonas macrotermitis]SHE50429.1 Outer membrane protein beta-barrel domain-containing protein [Dysgonomonas macrotermitis]